MESAPQRRLTLREIMRTPFCRYEARTAASRTSMVLLYVLAGLLDLAGVVGVIMLIVFWRDEGITWRVLIGIRMISFYVPILAALAAAAPAISPVVRALAGEKERDTLDSLILTTIPRRTVVWAKLLGRTAPLRRFMVAVAPAYLLGFTVFVASFSMLDVVGELNWGRVMLAGLAAVLCWLVIFLEAHCVAIIALYCSARGRNSLAAGVLAYVLTFVPPLITLCYFPAVISIYHFALGVVLFRRLVRNFDKYVLTD